MAEFKYVKNCWYPMGLSTEFTPGELQSHTVVAKPFVMWRSKENGKVVGFDDRCCHKRFPLSESDLLEDGTLRCAYHGLTYDTSGQCVAIPAQPDKPIPKQARLRAAPVREQDGVVWLWPGDPEVAESINPPPTPELSSKETVTVGVPMPLRVPANYLLLIENLLDITHFFPLHDGNIGDEENSRIPVEYEEGEENGCQYIKTIRHTKLHRQPSFFKEWFHYDEVERLHTHCMVTPGLTRVELRVAPPGELNTEAERGYTLLHLHLPVDERNLVWRWLVSCNKDHTPLSDPSISTVEKIAEMFPEVVAQDEWALEKQQKMHEFPDDGYSELFLKTDMAVRRARQILMDMQRKERAETVGHQAPQPTEKTASL
ncbi:MULTISPECIES: aromatic ring-hydroxylating dioxygenase subunit alpha [unclassified Marinobacter]|uniref:aromatic ring-hydroxylating dioxygenase subunit alpha n=1 Tax=unclassified Marinobacter TaxID=83889 RepID=UPI00200DD743|nr:MULTISPECIES: aromatic ring-hydroxylating dioxygenase subunit alpha [unclassified Marinobacter]UQG55158.1 aromatic ring-hydroxylating dioxygenase subunit alpha [Marinobacter sp. M4C]UQG63960.1 aromatic ring-hydroxylating dioxygenase subunit alpha [Marinobacter sp. M2C]UQG68243.1 aromatic ring-hydroxylating dioxygenase subunit alpha [Marinobacter sp. M1C]